MADVRWEQLLRNGQLIWKQEPEHRLMLERFWAFYKNTAEEAMIRDKYKEFVEQKDAEISIDIPMIELPAEPAPVAEGEIAEIIEPAPKKKGRRKSSPSTDE